MDKYDVISLNSCDSEAKFQKLEKLILDLDIIVPFDGEFALLAYSKPEHTADFKKVMKQHSILYFDLKVSVSSEEVGKFVSKVNKKKLVKIGDIVKVSGYGNAPFIITETYDDVAHAKIDLFNYTTTVVLPYSKFSLHPNPHDISFSPLIENINENICVIDVKLLNKEFNLSTISSKLYTLIRIKSIMHKGGKIALHNPTPEFLEIAKVFGLATSTGTIKSKTAVVYPNSNLGLYTNSVFELDNGFLHKTSMTIENKFITFLTIKKYNFSKEQIHQHFQDTSRFVKQRREFFEELNLDTNGKITHYTTSISVIQKWLKKNKLGQFEENLTLYMKLLIN